MKIFSTGNTILNKAFTLRNQHVHRKNGNSDRPLSSWAPKSLWTVTAAMKLKDACSLVGGKKQKKTRLLLERKAMTNVDSVLKRRDITLPTKVCIVKAMVFPVVMYGSER